MKRRLFMAGIASTVTASLAGCIGGSGVEEIDVTELDFNVDFVYESYGPGEHDYADAEDSPLYEVIAVHAGGDEIPAGLNIQAQVDGSIADMRYLEEPVQQGEIISYIYQVPGANELQMTGYSLTGETDVTLSFVPGIDPEQVEPPEEGYVNEEGEFVEVEEPDYDPKRAVFEDGATQYGQEEFASETLSLPPRRHAPQTEINASYNAEDKQLTFFHFGDKDITPENTSRLSGAGDFSPTFNASEDYIDEDGTVTGTISRGDVIAADFEFPEDGTGELIWHAAETDDEGVLAAYPDDLPE